jgi:hypothetical protein
MSSAFIAIALLSSPFDVSKCPEYVIANRKQEMKTCISRPMPVDLYKESMQCMGRMQAMESLIRPVLPKLSDKVRARMTQQADRLAAWEAQFAPLRKVRRADMDISTGPNAFQKGQKTVAPLFDRPAHEKAQAFSQYKITDRCRGLMTYFFGNTTAYVEVVGEPD